MSTKIISAFSGLGKTQYCSTHKDALDIESSWFNEYGDGKFLIYLHEILKAYRSGKYKYIFVSTHDEIRSLLKEHNLPYVTLIPTPNRQQEFLANNDKREHPVERYKNPQMWSCDVKRLEDYKEQEHVIEVPNGYITDELLSKIK